MIRPEFMRGLPGVGEESLPASAHGDFGRSAQWTVPAAGEDASSPRPGRVANNIGMHGPGRPRGIGACGFGIPLV
jgi:hypothetical protein